MLFWSLVLIAVAGAACAAHTYFTRPSLVIDTDVGDDVDDAVCLWVALTLHRWGVVRIIAIITSGDGNHEKRAALVKRLMLSVLGESSGTIRIIRGVKNTGQGTAANYMDCGVYPGDDVHTVEESRGWLLQEIGKNTILLCIGPLDNVRVLDLPNVRYVIMTGCFKTNFDGREGQIAEYNARKDILNLRWLLGKERVTLVPLDAAGTCRIVGWDLRGFPSSLCDMYMTWYTSVLDRDGSSSRILRHTVAPGETPHAPGTRSSILFDVCALAVCLYPGWFDMWTTGVTVDDDGKTHPCPSATPVRIAMRWKDKDQFPRWMARVRQYYVAA